MKFFYKLFYKFFYMGLVFVVYSGTIHAAYDADALQKLFTDKKQRAQIDAVRAGNYSATGLHKQANKIKVQGYVTRSGGKSVVWLNDKNTIDSSKIGEIKVQKTNIGKNKKVGVTLDGIHVHLKPGETWNKETGKIVDNQ